MTIEDAVLNVNGKAFAVAVLPAVRALRAVSPQLARSTVREGNTEVSPRLRRALKCVIIQAVSRHCLPFCEGSAVIAERREHPRSKAVCLLFAAGLWDTCHSDTRTASGVNTGAWFRLAPLARLLVFLVLSTILAWPCRLLAPFSPPRPFLEEQPLNECAVPL